MQFKIEEVYNLESHIPDFLSGLQKEFLDKCNKATLRVIYGSWRLFYDPINKNLSFYFYQWQCSICLGEFGMKFEDTEGLAYIYTDQLVPTQMEWDICSMTYGEKLTSHYRNIWDSINEVLNSDRGENG